MLRRIHAFLAQTKGESVARKLALVRNRAEYAVRRALNQPSMVKEVNGVKMCLNLRRPGVSRTLAVWGIREELETELFISHLSEGMVVFDLGANIGYYALLAASIVSPSGKVYAIEPFPASFETLVKSVELNGFSDFVECHQIAIWDRVGTTQMFIGDADNLHTLMDLSPYRSTSGQTKEVATITLDKFLENRGEIGFLRMDIEGGECQVFDSMDRVLAQEIPPRILFEIHPLGDIDPDPRFTLRLERLSAVGYRARAVISSTHKTSMGKFADLGYYPRKTSRTGAGLFENIAKHDLVKVAARRPKITRSILLIHEADLR